MPEAAARAMRVGWIGALSRIASVVTEMTSRLDEMAGLCLSGWVEELAALHALQVQAQAMLGMMMRLAAELGYSPESPGDAAKALLAEGVISREDYEFSRRVAGSGNVLARSYADVDVDLVRGILARREYSRVAELGLEAPRGGGSPPG